MKPYSLETIEVIRTCYNTLSEKDKRRYATTEAVKLGHGSVSYIVDAPACARSIIHIGIGELKSMPPGTVYQFADLVPDESDTTKLLIPLMPPSWLWLRTISLAIR